MRAGLLAAGLLVVAVAGLGAFYWQYELYGLNVLWRRAGTYFVTVTPADPRLPPSMRTALQQPPPRATAGAMEWREPAPGLEVAELPVLAGGVEVDRILLTRLDPGRFRFQVLTRPAGDLDLDGWMARERPAVVINGSYFDQRGRPATPIKSGNAAAGPDPYQAQHGIMVVSGQALAIHDLKGIDWRPLRDQAREAMVSYPLLLAPDGTIRVKSDPRWLANRSFIGQDRAGRVILGTTKEAFFPLDRLARFLHEAPLDLDIALNLDGGPLACQAVGTSAYRRDFCGSWETQTRDGEIALLRPVLGARRWALPIVLAAFPVGP